MEYDITKDGTQEVHEPHSKWSGPWTNEKLDAFEKYVGAYLQIMKKYAPNNRWKLFYFDAFAGSGDTGTDDNLNKDTDFGTFDFEDIEQVEDIVEESNYKGAAERVLGLDIDGFSFDYYYFVDKSQDSLNKLEAKLKSSFPAKTRAMSFKQGDANERVLELVNYAKSHPNCVALVLLDPFGMQIKWETIKALKDIKHLDLWILVPSGVIINRLLTRRKGIMFPEKVSALFGLPIDDIQKYFYEEKKYDTLFGEKTVLEKCNDAIAKIAKLYLDRLSNEFEFVIEEPLVLRNSTNCPIFHFVFASHNATAKKIASQIVIKKNKRR